MVNETVELLPTCAVCDSADFLRDSHGQGGLNDVCRPCFFIWYDGGVGCERPEHRDQRPHVHGEDIRTYNLKARAEGTWPFNSPEFATRTPLAEDPTHAK